ncbi:MAG: hypothetical protein NTW47_07475 [Proteobacteria bacterium]|nr:hypothetical protein [Pseudomonadota bacterium]
MSVACEFDHLIVGAHTLEEGAAFIEEPIGVKPQAGGRALFLQLFDVPEQRV